MTLSCKTPTRILLRAQKQQLCLRGHLNPRVFYCLVTEPSGLIPVKHSNQDKNQRTRYLFSLSLPRCERGDPEDKCLQNIAWDLCIWPRLWKPFTPIPEILSHSLELTRKLLNRGKCQVRLHSNTGRTHLPWGTRPPTKEAIAGVWRCQL